MLRQKLLSSCKVTGLIDENCMESTVSLNVVIGRCLFVLCILHCQSDAQGIYGLQKPDWPEDIRELTWDSWKQRRKGILWHWNVFDTAVFLQSVDENEFVLQKVDYLKPVPNGKKDFADHSMIH